MAKHLANGIPPPLPDRLGPARARPASLLDAVHRMVWGEFNEDTERAATFRRLMNTTNTVDAVHGKYLIDAVVAAQILVERADEKGETMVLSANLAQIINKLQLALRRHDTPEVAYSRSARFRQLTASKEAKAAAAAAEAAAANSAEAAAMSRGAE